MVLVLGLQRIWLFTLVLQRTQSCHSIWQNMVLALSLAKKMVLNLSTLNLSTNSTYLRTFNEYIPQCKSCKVCGFYHANDIVLTYGFANI